MSSTYTLTALPYYDTELLQIVFAYLPFKSELEPFK